MVMRRKTLPFPFPPATLLPSSFLLLAAGCAIPISSVWETRSAHGVVRRTGDELVEIDCPADADVLDLELVVDCRKGAVAVCLIDPHGVVRWQDRLHGGRRESELHLPPLVGRWTCTLDFTGFDGDWSLVLEAHSEPQMRLRVTGIEVKRSEEQ
jgi:hypothetical protein